MNQPNLPVMAPRPAAAPEATDMLVALRRYAWLLICGAIVGGAVGTGLYMYMRTYEPRYTASVAFQVQAPPALVGQEGQASPNFNTQDEVSSLIHRQALLFEQETFLEDIINSAEFHTNPGDPSSAGTGESTWLHDNKAKVIYAIKRDLKVVPRLNAGSFEITMTARDAFEAYNLVNAAKDVYLQHLKTANLKQNLSTLTNLRDALTSKKADFDNASQALALWAKANRVDVQRSQFEIDKNELQALNEEYIRANALAVTAKAQFDLITGLLKDAKKTDQTDPKKVDASGVYDTDKLKTIPLTPEIEASLENDPTIRTLDSEKLSYLQELAVENGKPAPSKPRLIDITSRLEEIATQRTNELGRLHSEAAVRMAEMAKNDSDSKAALTSSVDFQRKDMETNVRDIGAALMDYQQRFDDLTQKQDMLHRVENQYELAEANRTTDDVRIQPLADAYKPNEISSPYWLYYIPVGTAAGLGLSALLAYLLLLTDTRVRTPRDISRSLQMSLLGFVPDEGDDRALTGDVETAILSSPASMVAESFRQIRSHVTAQTAHNPVNTLLVASIAPGGGSTTVASNLAASMALNDIRVLLVDANFYRPGLSRVANNVPATGLADALNDPTTLEASIVAHPSLPKLHMLGAGSELAGASSELFEGRAFRELVDRLKSRYDMIIFDGAPLNLVSDSLALAARVDGVIPVVRAGEVSRGTVSRIRDQLRNVHANLLGFVLNAVQTNNSGYFKENYRTYFRYAGQGRRTANTK